VFEASCPGCGVAASPYEAQCACGASLRVPCRECGSLVHVAESACYGCGAGWPADPRPRPALESVALPTDVADAPTTSDSADGSAPDPAERTDAVEPGRPRSRRLVPLVSLALVGLVVASGAVLVAGSRGAKVPSGGVSSAAASPSAATASTAPTTSVPSAADVERDRLAAELRFGLALPETQARCLADGARAALGDAAFVAAHLDLTGSEPAAGHAVLDPVIAAARETCGVPAPPGG
jgi:hypothetical protein